MASQPPKDAAAKTRIITHMNTDHQDSLIRYLQHFAHLSPISARNAHLADFTFSSLTILSSKEQAHTIPITPSMTSWADARPRVVAMGQEAVAALKKSSITVKRYKPPRSYMTAIMAASALTFILFSRRANFLPGSLLYNLLLLNHMPNFANFCWKIQPLVIYPMLVLHSAEAAHMQRSRLEKHTVRIFGWVWWAWMGSAFVEGFTSFWRFDEVVGEEEGKKKAAKH